MVLKIGDLELDGNVVLAPMVEVTDLPYRLICKKAGAALAYTEMAYVDALLYENSKTLRMVKTDKKEGLVGLQITGSKLEHFEKFVLREELWKDYDKIDLNCGCPSLKIAGKGRAGSFLMKSPEKIGEIVKILKKTGKTVSVKVRLGFDEINVLEVAKVAEEAGADSITVHARLATEGGRDRARWDWIGKIKKAVKIPVIGNGDVRSGEDAERMLRETGCDGVMIARAAIGDPLIFNRVRKYLKNGKEEEMNIGENLKLYLEYLDLQEKHYGLEVEIARVKQIGGKFLKKFKHAASERENFYGLRNLDEMKEFIRGITLYH